MIKLNWLNCLWISSLVAADDITKKGYLKLAESFFTLIEKKYINRKIFIVIQKILFLEDYAFLIYALNDLSDKTMNFKYKELARKITSEALKKFYINNKNIFKKIN